MLARRRSFDVSMHNHRQKMRNQEKLKGRPPCAREGGSRWRVSQPGSLRGSDTVAIVDELEELQPRRKSSVWDRAGDSPVQIPTITIEDYSTNQSFHECPVSRTSTNDSERAPLIRPRSNSAQDRGKPLKRRLSRGSGQAFLAIPTSNKDDNDDGNAHPKEDMHIVPNATNNNVKTTSTPSALFFIEEDENPSRTTGKYRRRSSGQFSASTRRKSDVGRKAETDESFLGGKFGRRTSACASIPERGDEDGQSRPTCTKITENGDCRTSTPNRSSSNLTTPGEYPSISYFQQRRSSRTFTVMNYGDIAACPLKETAEIPVNPCTACDGDDLEMTQDHVDRERKGEREHQQEEKDEEEDEEELEDESYISDGCSVESSASRLEQLMALRALHEQCLARGSATPSELSSLPNDFHPNAAAFDRRRMSTKTQNHKTLPIVAKRGALYTKRKKERLVNKDGDFNIQFKNISRKHQSYLADVFTTLLDMKWRFTLLLFIIAFVLSWVGFALIWWLVAFMHGDTRTAADGVSVNSTIPCVFGVQDFTSALLYSIETQHTIGYGTRAITTECGHAVFLLMLQSIFGVVIQCVMAGVFLAKLARPKRRGETIMFSRQAVICQEDGQYCLLFRVGDMRRSQLVGAMLHAMFVKKRVTKEGDEIPFYQCHLEMTAESEDYDQFIFLSWPIRIVHKINENSPLWNISAEKLVTETFEIIVVLEGVVESTGMCMQARTSYLPSEIKWGHRLAPLLTVCNRQDGKFEIDYAQFHNSLPLEMPECSAQASDESNGPARKDVRGFRNYGRKRHLVPLGETILDGQRPLSGDMFV